MNIALIGMMGTMKTSVGKALAVLTGRKFVDSDDEFVREEGRSIAATFADKGEAYFRERETAIVKRLAAADETVISCGGGVPLKRENADALRSSSVVVLLTSTPARILERTGTGESRPLLGGGGLARIEALCAARAGAYNAAADLIVDTTDLTPDEAAAEIAAAIGRMPDKV